MVVIMTSRRQQTMQWHISKCQSNAGPTRGPGWWTVSYYFVIWEWWLIAYPSDQLPLPTEFRIPSWRIELQLYFVKLLKRAGLSTDDFYVTVIRPISEYACTVWNHNLTSILSDQLESYQKRALRIIYGDQIKGMPFSVHFCWLI